MKSKVKPIPEGFHAVTPFLSIKGTAKAIASYKKAFAAKEIMRLPARGDGIGHAEIEIGDSRIMLADEYPDLNFHGPKTFGGTSVHIHLYVLDVDKVVKKAVAAGAKVLRPVIDQFYGDRSGSPRRSLRPCLACGDAQRRHSGKRAQKTHRGIGCLG